ncbi:uncharacterized protein LOC118803456 isoform X2 [Colossoma macropomum]|uniref:uncharacterized protein LOC118803456 isoform X2 n=1 Tax=Colossoma macropomum TaxID=42526 RepID=UPI001864F8A1|nr:uncharacterized protein LOC118803456 isoform X2 [Colossoma macropomum]
MSVMQSCSSALCILILLITPFPTGSVSAVPQVKVNLHDSAILPCSERCSGLVRWTVFRKPTDVLAECDQTSCRSKEGYQMIHDQYLKGNLSLTITDADFSKRNMYTCTCDNMAVCDVSLRLQAPVYSKKMKPGESLILDLPISEPVKVTFDRTGDSDPNPVKLCEVEGRKIQCDPPYEERVLFQSSLQLNDLKDSDGGVYTVLDTENEETVSTYRVSIVKVGQPSDTCSWEKFGIGVAFFCLGALLGYFVPGPVVRFWGWLKRKIQPFCCEKERSAEEKRLSSTPESTPLEEVSSGSHVETQAVEDQN